MTATATAAAGAADDRARAADRRGPARQIVAWRAPRPRPAARGAAAGFGRGCQPLARDAGGARMMEREPSLNDLAADAALAGGLSEPTRLRLLAAAEGVA